MKAIAAAIRMTLVALALALLGAPAPAHAQCGPARTGDTGGAVNTVARIHPSGRLLVGMGATVRLVDASNPDAPLLVGGFPPFSFPVLGLDVPAVKIAAQPGTGRAYVLQEDGDGVAVQISSQFELVPDDLMPFGHFFNCVDVVADGALFYAVEDDEIEVYDTSAFTLNRVSTIQPRFNNHVFDRAVKVGNILWVGFHEDNSVIYGISGFDMSNPASPQHVATSLNTVGFGVNEAKIVAMANMGSNLIIAYKNRVGDFNTNDWFRVVSVGTPLAPAWRTGYDSGGWVAAMSTISTYLHLAMGGDGLSIWDIETSGAAMHMDEFDASWLNAADVWCTGGTDYVAAGLAGLALMNTVNPFDIEQRALLPGLPARASIIRASGREPATVVVLDAGTSSSTDSMLRVYTTQSPGLISWGARGIGPGNLHTMELYVTAGGVYACVGVGNTVEIIDISSNLAAPQLLNVIQVGAAPFLMSTNSGRLYVFDHLSRLHVIDMATPAFPVVRSSTQYGGGSFTYTCMTAWSLNNDHRLALGNSTLGLWIFDTSNMQLPQVQSIWNPAPGYAVHSIHPGNIFESPMLFYVNSSVPFGNFDRTYAMEVLNISNLVHPTSVWRTDSSTGGDPGLALSLHLTGNATTRFLIGVEPDTFIDDGFDDDFFNRDGVIKFFDITNTSFPVRIQGTVLWDAVGQVASYARGARMFVPAGEAGVYELTTPTEWRPAFVRQPQNQVVCYGGGDAVVDLGTPAVSASPAAVTYQWHRNGVPLVNGPTPWGSVISGATGTTLRIADPRREDGRSPNGFNYSYSCHATNACDTTFSRFFTVRVCLADLNCDEVTDVFDLLAYLSQWFAGELASDRTGDGNVDVFDLLAYLDAWFAGC